MHDRKGHRLAGLGIGLALLLAGCGSDDGTGVRNVDGTQAASGGGTASGSFSSSTVPSAARGRLAGSAARTTTSLWASWPVLRASKVTVPAGSYALFCNLLETEADGSKENHYANGMRTRFEARG